MSISSDEIFLLVRAARDDLSSIQYVLFEPPLTALFLGGVIHLGTINARSTRQLRQSRPRTFPSFFLTRLREYFTCVICRRYSTCRPLWAFELAIYRAQGKLVSCESEVCVSFKRVDALFGFSFHSCEQMMFLYRSALVSEATGNSGIALGNREMRNGRDLISGLLPLSYRSLRMCFPDNALCDILIGETLDESTRNHWINEAFQVGWIAPNSRVSLSGSKLQSQECFWVKASQGKWWEMAVSVVRGTKCS